MFNEVAAPVAGSCLLLLQWALLVAEEVSGCVNAT